MILNWNPKNTEHNVREVLHTLAEEYPLQESAQNVNLVIPYRFGIQNQAGLNNVFAKNKTLSEFIQECRDRISGEWDLYII